MNQDFSQQNFFTVLIALALSFVFACSSGTLRMKAPEETELTMAQVLSGKLGRKK